MDTVCAHPTWAHHLRCHAPDTRSNLPRVRARGALKVLDHRGRWHVQCRANLAQAQLLIEGKSRDFSDASDGDTGSGHGPLLERKCPKNLAPAPAHADVKCPLDGAYENSETAVRIRPKRVSRARRNVTVGIIEVINNVCGH